LSARPKAPKAAPLPTREALLAFIESQPGKVGKREIARAFKLDAGGKVALKGLLRELEDEGRLDRKGKRLHRPGTLPSVVLAEVKKLDRDGELLAEPAEWDEEEHGAAPKILLTFPSRGRKPGFVPGIGDRALVRVEPTNEEEGPAYTGRVVKLLERDRARVLGVFRALPGGGGRLIPVDKRSAGREIAIPVGSTGDAEEGDIVSVEVGRTSGYAAPKARVRERLGSLKNERAVSMLAIHAHGIPHSFRADTLAEAEAIQPVGMRGREDWRELPLVTIDPPDAKDHDDAVHAVADDDPVNEGGFVITVAIADVAAYVRPGSPLDREAAERGNSVYFPDRVVPMLPERISNDLCSLRPHEDRPALAVRMIVDRRGHKRSHGFHRIMMRSAARLAYAQAQAAIDGSPDDVTGPLVEPVLRPLYGAYEALKRARTERGPLDLDLPERKILLKADGTVDRVIVPERLDAHRLIEEFMILANVAAAETLEHKRTPLVYRVHDSPSPEKVNALREVLASLGLSVIKGGEMRPSHFNGILARVAETPNATLVNEVVLRSQAQAEYTAENYGHFGLNLKRYAHFTSPIRRYADLVVHRALIRALGLGTDGQPEHTTREQLAETAAKISVAERRAMAAERETADRLIAHFLADKIGATFEGRVSGVTRSGLFVKLKETGADGFVPAATLGDDFFAHDEARQALIGSRTGEAFQLGDPVEVRLIEAAPVAGALRFEVLSEGRHMKPGPRGKRAVRRVVGRAKTPENRRGPTRKGR
jgi:ribonuclease R